MKNRIKASVTAMAMLLTLTGQGVAMAATPTVEYTYERELTEELNTLWDYTEKDLSFGTGTHLYEKKLDDTHGDVLVMASASTNATTILTPTIQLPVADISYISFDFMPKSAEYPIGIDLLGINSKPCGICFNINGLLLMGQGWIGNLVATTEADINKWQSHTKYGAFNANEWVNIKIVNDQKEKEISFYVDGVLFKTESTALDHFKSMRIVQYNAQKNVQKGTEMLYIDNVKIGTASDKEKWSFANGLVMEGFGLCDSDGKMIDDVQSDVYAKTKLSNTSENPMKLLVLVTGYKDGMIESADFGSYSIDIGGEVLLDNENNPLFLDTGKEYDRIQLSVLDGEEGYPLIEARELKASE